MAVIIPPTFHRLVFAFSFFAFYYDCAHVSPPVGSRDHFVRNTLGGFFKYLTVINYAVLQVGYFGLCLINDMIGNNAQKHSQKSLLERFRDFVFTTLCVPIAPFVCSTFWILYFIDREIIFGVENDVWFPAWLNHAYHTLPLITVATELTIVHHSFPQGILKYIPVFGAFIAYSMWVFYIAYKLDFWVYTVLEVLSIPYRLLFMGSTIVPGVFAVYLGHKCHQMIWGSEDKSSRSANSESEKKKKRKAL